MTAAPTTSVPGHSRARRYAITAALGGFLFGFDTSVVNGAVTALSDEFGTSAFSTGFVVAAALLGSAVGAWYAGRLADRAGRVPVMLVAAALFAVSALGSGLVGSAWQLVVWRVVGGVAVGAASVIAPAYIAEVSPAPIRGRLGSYQQLAIVLGIFAALLSDAVLAGVAGGAGETLWAGLAAWRWMFLAAVVPAAVYALTALRLPESPRYLVRRGRTDEARAVLRRVLPDGEVEERLAEIRVSMRADRPARLRDLRGPRFGLLPLVWVGIGLSVFQQFVGINVIFYYSTTLWSSVGFSTADSFRISVFTSVVNIATTLVAVLLIDRVGRRRLLLVGSVGMTVSLAVLAALFLGAPTTGGAPDLTGAGGLAALVAANAFVVFFGMSWGPAVWVLLGEMFDNRRRAVALATAAAAQWVANFAVTLTFPVLSDRGVGLPYVLYAVAAAVSILLVLRGVPETTGRELEQMATGTDGTPAATGRAVP